MCWLIGYNHMHGELIVDWEDMQSAYLSITNTNLDKDVISSDMLKPSEARGTVWSR